jgi:UDP-2,3-diacylglucosamine pyrophosphatase LpxH
MEETATSPPEAVGPCSRVVIVGDLHIAAGNEREPFCDDGVLARFLEYLTMRLEPERSTTRLLILGDLFDFLEVTRPSRQPGRAWREMSEAASVAKLECAAAAHEGAMRAFADFAGAGFAVSIVPGNHDIELGIPAVQRRLLALIDSEKQGAAGQICFHPWIFTVPGLIYAEHGSQYHDLNAFARLIDPSYMPGNAPLELPVGSHISLYLVDLAEALGGSVGTSATRRLAGALLAWPPILPRVLVLHARLAAAVFAAGLAPTRLSWRRRRATYRSQTLSRYAEDVGLRAETLEAIDGLAALGPFAVERRAIRQLIVGTTALRRASAAPADGSDSFLHRAARSIDALLAAERQQVPYYVFGHSHLPADERLDDRGRSGRYLNPGTWSSLLPRKTRGLGDRARFTFVEIAREHAYGAPSAQLLRWNDERGRTETCEFAP